jgi:hypothetical protein
MRTDWSEAAFFLAIPLLALVLVWGADRDAQRDHEAKMAGCTTTIQKTDLSRIGD